MQPAWPGWYGSTIQVGNPYRRLLNQPGTVDEVNAWARVGFRRGLANYPWYCDAKAGHIVVSERDGHRLQIFDILGAETKFQPHGSYGFRANQFISPGGVTTTMIPGADVICADTGNRRIVVMQKGCDFQGNGTLSTTMEFGKQQFQQPMGIEYEPERNLLAVTDTVFNTVTIHDLHTSQTVGKMRVPQNKPLMMPTDVTFDQSGRVYVVDAASSCVHIYDRNNNFVKTFGEDKLRKPWGICFDRQKNILVSDEDAGSILMYKEGGEFNKVVTDDLYLPKGISVNQYEMLVVTTGNPYNFLQVLQFK